MWLNRKRQRGAVAAAVKEGVAFANTLGITYDVADALSDIPELIPATISEHESIRKTVEAMASSGGSQ